MFVIAIVAKRFLPLQLLATLKVIRHWKDKGYKNFTIEIFESKEELEKHQNATKSTCPYDESIECTPGFFCSSCIDPELNYADKSKNKR